MILMCFMCLMQPEAVTGLTRAQRSSWSVEPSGAPLVFYSEVTPALPRGVPLSCLIHICFVLRFVKCLWNTASLFHKHFSLSVFELPSPLSMSLPRFLVTALFLFSWLSLTCVSVQWLLALLFPHAVTVVLCFPLPYFPINWLVLILSDFHTYRQVPTHVPVQEGQGCLVKGGWWWRW